MTSPAADSPPRADLPVSIALAAIGALSMSLYAQTLLSDYALAGTMISRPLWSEIVALLGGRIALAGGGTMATGVPLAPLLAGALVAAVLCWVGGAAVIALRSHSRFKNQLFRWAHRAFCWWLVPGAWVLLWTVGALLGWDTLQTVLAATPQLWLAVPLAGFAATLFSMCANGACSTAFGTTDGPQISAAPQRAESSGTLPSIPASVWIAAAVYVIAFTAMNWQLYRGLLLPHGDSAMYEEHLWNLEHGKGFRSFLDPGLFLGEHIQVIHLLLVPLHYFWPSQLLLELCESLALAAGAIPVFLIGRRHTGSDKAGMLLALAYLLYFPLQFLDVAIDLKTFRPIAFGVPLLLFAIDRMERGRWISMSLLLLLALCAKEDYSLVIAPLGAWLLLRGGAGLRSNPNGESKRARVVGGAMALLSAGYLLLVLLVLIPAFREGHDPHYTGYFGWLREAAGNLEDGGSRMEDGEAGGGPVAIARVMIERPSIWLGRLFSLRSLLYALTLLVPLGGLALLSPGRLLVALPLFAVLCLMEVSGGVPGGGGFPLVPFHHFHAPLVPILLWATAAGLSKARPILFSRHFVWTSAAASGLFFSLSPLGAPFWDAGSQWYWRSLYLPGERAERFPAVLAMIPKDARVASTDLIHPRFTHHARSYDYSSYPRAVNDYKPGAPPDTDFIVIDKQARYSEIRRPDDVREYRESPEAWELLLDCEYFIVLKRRRVKRD